MKEVQKCLNFLKTGDYRGAIEAGKKAVAKYPNNPKAHYWLGVSYIKIGEFELALVHMKKAASLISNKKDLMKIYNQIGMIYDTMGYLLNALLYYSKSLSLARELGDRSMQASVLNNIAEIYLENEELDKVLEYCKESLRLETDKDSTYNIMATIYIKQGDYQKAVEYFKKAIEIEEKYGDYHGASLTKLCLGDIYRKLKDYEKAEKYLLEGLEGVKKVGDKFWEVVGYKYLGWLYIEKGDEKTAKEYLTRAYKMGAWDVGHVLISLRGDATK
jgi:pentatricopeptide repeat protein